MRRAAALPSTRTSSAGDEESVEALITAGQAWNQNSDDAEGKEKTKPYAIAADDRMNELTAIYYESRCSLRRRRSRRHRRLSWS